MKFISIALMLFMLNISIGIIQYLDVTEVDVAYQQAWVNQVSDQAFINQSYENSKITDPTMDQGEYGNFKLGLKMLLDAFVHAVFGFYWMLVNFGTPPGLAALLSAPFYLMYILGIVQFFSKNSTDGYR